MMELLITIVVLVLVVVVGLFVLSGKSAEVSVLRTKYEEERAKWNTDLDKARVEINKHRDGRVELSDKLNSALKKERDLQDELSKVRQESKLLNLDLTTTTQDQQNSIKSLQGELQESQKSAQVLKRENAQKGAQLEEVRKLLALRPEEKSVAYKVVTVGIVASGKTSLLLKWANPTWEVKCKHEQTSFNRYAKVVSRCRSQDRTAIINYEFELLDFGGEKIVDAAFAAAEEGVDGMLIVLDAGKDRFGEEQRIREQKTQFSEETLKFFFAKKITNRCKTFIVFINKSDLFDGRPSEVEREAKELYRDTLDTIERICSSGLNLRVEVVVGSAFSGHNTHNLFSHFVKSILPRHAYNPELMQGIQNDTGGSDE